MFHENLGVVSVGWEARLTQLKQEIQEEEGGCSRRGLSHQLQQAQLH